MPSAPAPEPDLALFVSCVRDKPVTRLPLPGARPRARVLIGARIQDGRTVYNEAVIVALTRAEVTAHGKVYERTIGEGHLRRRTRAEYDAQLAAVRERKAKANAAGGES